MAYGLAGGETVTVPVLRYKRAPEGSPDSYVLTDDASFIWSNPPDWVWSIVSRMNIRLPSGFVAAGYNAAMEREITVCVFEGYFFGVSVAPDGDRVTPDACLHDWLYENAKELASYWSCKESDVLAIADHWFLALMRFSGFSFKRTYFIGVRLFGRLFHSLVGKDKT